MDFLFDNYEASRTQKGRLDIRQWSAVPSTGILLEYFLENGMSSGPPYWTVRVIATSQGWKDGLEASWVPINGELPDSFELCIYTWEANWFLKIPIILDLCYLQVNLYHKWCNQSGVPECLCGCVWAGEIFTLCLRYYPPGSKWSLSLLTQHLCWLAGDHSSLHPAVSSFHQAKIEIRGELTYQIVPQWLLIYSLPT